MEQFTIEDMQDIELNLLKVFDKFCSERNIRYSIAGGTLIGAVRHGGFIPWDDDIDIIVPRTDYDKLLQYKEDLEFPYKIESPYDKREKYDEPYNFAYAKLFDLRTTLIEFPETKRVSSHVYIDIFPSDGMPREKKDIEKHYKKAHKLILIRSVANASYYRSKMKESGAKVYFWKMIYAINNFLPQGFFFKMLDKHCRKYSIENTKNMGVIVAGYGIKECIDQDVFFPLKRITFDGVDVSVMNNYDAFLRQLYGDYMQLPPESKRKANHYYEAYWS